MTTDAENAHGGRGAIIAVALPELAEQTGAMLAHIQADVPVMHDVRDLSGRGVEGVSLIVVAVHSDLRGLRMVAAAHRRVPHAPIVVLCELTDTDQFLDFLMAGAAGFCDPSHGADAVSRTIDAVLVDGVAIPRTLVRPLVDLVRDGRGHSISTMHGADITVTRREWEVLLLMRQQRTTREIAEELFVSTATVRSHISSILQKLGARDRDEALVLLEAE